MLILQSVVIRISKWISVLFVSWKNIATWASWGKVWKSRFHCEISARLRKLASVFLCVFLYCTRFEYQPITLLLVGLRLCIRKWKGRILTHGSSFSFVFSGLFRQGKEVLFGSHNVFNSLVRYLVYLTSTSDSVVCWLMHSRFAPNQGRITFLVSVCCCVWLLASLCYQEYSCIYSYMGELTVWIVFPTAAIRMYRSPPLVRLDSCLTAAAYLSSAC